MEIKKVGRPRGKKPSRSFRLTDEQHAKVKIYIEELRTEERKKKRRAKLKEMGLI